MDFLLHNGVGQNIFAGLLMGVPGFFFAHRHFRRRLVELHAHLDQLHRSVLVGKGGELNGKA
jgi:hypothetical protein